MSVLEINAFGMGINSDDVTPFFGSDFHMPAGWTGKGPGSRPKHAKPGMRFVLFGDGLILATVEYVDCTTREHRWEHRPSPDGTRQDYGQGLVLDLNPNSWEWLIAPCDAVGQSYRYGHLEGRVFTQIKVD